MMWWMLGLTAFAADWLTLQGSEYGREDEGVRLFGFVQPQLDAFVGGDLVNGRRPVFNSVGGAPSSFQVWRARLAARGAVPNTNQQVSYYLMMEAGEVALTRASPVVFSDLSVTLSAPKIRFRAGQFKLPVMEEIVQGVASSLEFIHFSNTLTGLLLENTVDSDGAYVGNAFGFRDVGIQVFEGFQEGHWAGSYAAMLSNGSGLHARDSDAAKDVSLRGEFAWVDGERASPRRREVKVGAWWLEGTRPDGDDRARRSRRGAFLHVEQQKYWGLLEVAQGVGSLEAGRSPPFPEGAIVVAPEGRAWGVVAQSGVRLNLSKGTLGFKGRYDRYHRRTEDAAALRVFQTGTLGAEYTPTPKVRIQGNYELRRLTAPHGDAAALVVTSSMADRVTVQVTAIF